MLLIASPAHRIACALNSAVFRIRCECVLNRFEVINFCSGLTQMVVSHLPPCMQPRMRQHAPADRSLCAGQVDQSYWQTAIAGKASSTAKAHMITP